MNETQLEDKSEYWDYINKLKAEARPLVPDTVAITYTVGYLESQERLAAAVKLVASGMSKHKAARTAHVGEVRLRCRLKELEKNNVE